MWIETQLTLGVGDATRLAHTLIEPGEPLWHLCLGDAARDTPKPPSWRDLQNAAKGLKEKALAGAQGLRKVKAADVVGGAVVLGGMLVADSALRAVGVDGGLELPAEAGPPTESPDGYILLLSPARLALAEVASAVVERPFALPKYWSRVRAVAQWSPEAIPAAGIRFSRRGEGRGARWRLTLEAEGRSFDFGAHLKAYDNVEQAAAIAARVAGLGGTSSPRGT